MVEAIPAQGECEYFETPEPSIILNEEEAELQRKIEAFEQEV